MSKNLSQIVTELFAKPMEGKELLSQVQRLGDEIRKVAHSDDTMSGKFLGLLESFRTIIPDEKQRYQAVLQALSTTSKLGRQEIIQAINSQLVELKIVENGLMPSQHSWRDALKGMESRALQLKGEMEQLRARLAQLEGEEKAIQAGIAAQEKDLASAENTVKELFANIGAEISLLSKKILDLAGETPTAPPTPPVAQPPLPAAQPAPSAPQPAVRPEPVKGSAPEKKKDEEKVELKVTSPPADTKFQRKCPMCGGPFNLLQLEQKWQCFTCAYEETADEVESAGEEEDETKNAPEPPIDLEEQGAASSVAEQADSNKDPAGPQKRSSPVGSQPGTKKKPCPLCKKKMVWHPAAKAWRCPSCYYEKRGA